MNAKLQASLQACTLHAGILLNQFIAGINTLLNDWEAVRQFIANCDVKAG